METAKQKYTTFKAQYQEARKQMLEQSREAFKEMASELFSTYPQMTEFSWEQYTPYWNDGDPCEFSVREYTARINGSCLDYGEEPNNMDQKSLETATKSVTTFISMFDEDVMLDMFGDHAQVTVYRDGKAEVESCAHD